MHKLRGIVFGFFIWLVYRALSLTWRIQIIEPPELKKDLAEKIPVILAHFHQDELALLALTPIYKIATMTSTSKDGEMMSTVLRLMGGAASRGSSTRGGANALKGLISLSRKGANSSVAVDGPRGPIFEIKPGVFALSRLLKSSIYAGGVFCQQSWKFPKAWNQTYLPKPFSRIFIVWVKAFDCVTKDQDPRSEVLAKALKNQLFAARQQACNLFGAMDSQL